MVRPVVEVEREEEGWWWCKLATGLSSQSKLVEEQELALEEKPGKRLLLLLVVGVGVAVGGS